VYVPTVVTDQSRLSNEGMLDDLPGSWLFPLVTAVCEMVHNEKVVYSCSINMVEQRGKKITILSTAFPPS
jgi:hypothetical protein